MSSSFIIRLANVHLNPLEDLADLVVESTASVRAVAEVREVPASNPVRVPDLNGGEVYKVKIFPRRHRAVGVFERASASGDKEVTVVCPAHPERVRSVVFPPFARLDGELQRVFERSRLEESERTGEALYRGLDEHQKAGLLNVYAKMQRTLFADGTRVSRYIRSFYRIRSDRVFADVDVALRDQVKSAVGSGLFREVSGALHQPPPGFGPAGSYKTSDAFGNLQLSFFSGLGSELAFKVDADVDDAGGILHIFQVLRNWITGKPSHPYDIHEILVYNQKLEPGYDLVMTA